jgi:GntR family transcriptional regulator
VAVNLPFNVAIRPGEPVTQQVVFAVTRAVVTGQLRPGDPFPSVRMLSQELRVNPNTAHKIVAALTDDGLLTVVPGVGTVVSETAARARSRTAAFDDQLERLVVDARRAGWTLTELIAQLREHWSHTSRRAG